MYLIFVTSIQHLIIKYSFYLFFLWWIILLNPKYYRKANTPGSQGKTMKFDDQSIYCTVESRAKNLVLNQSKLFTHTNVYRIIKYYNKLTIDTNHTKTPKNYRWYLIAKNNTKRPKTRTNKVFRKPKIILNKRSLLAQLYAAYYHSKPRVIQIW